jgi:D-arabinose 1-dehydrogenase-like Zn-dependent alcohol dehydrogenase
MFGNGHGDILRNLKPIVGVDSIQVHLSVPANKPHGSAALAHAENGERSTMKAGKTLVVIGCGGVGAPAAMFAKKLMPDVNVINIREEEHCIVR